MNILDFIEPAKIDTKSDSVVIIYNHKEISYGEFKSLTNKTALFLKSKGIKENDIVPLLFGHNPDFIVTIIALWKIGAVPAPLNTKLLQKDLNKQIELLKPVLVIKSKDLSDFSIRKKNITISLNDYSEYKNEMNWKKFSEEKTAMILFTSGSSEKPKAVIFNFNNLIKSATTGNKVLNQTSGDKWIASLPFYHIGGLSIIFRALMFGCLIIIPHSLSNKDLCDSINRYKPTLASLVSSQLKKFVDTDFYPPEELRIVLLGGGFTNRNLILRAIKNGWKIAKVYGSTETSSFISFMNYEEVKKKPEASGKVVPPHKIVITEEGEIVVQSPAVVKGYYNNNHETSLRFKDGFYFSGDIGKIDDERYLFVKAKRSDLIISGGENINPFEVEEAILSNSKVKEVCVIGLEDLQWGQIVCAAVVLKSKSGISENELINFLKSKLASFKIPKRTIFADQLPKSVLGKVQKEKIRELFNRINI